MNKKLDIHKAEFPSILGLYDNYFKGRPTKLQFMAKDHIYECVRKFEYYKDSSVNFMFQNRYDSLKSWTSFLKFEYQKEWCDLFIILTMIRYDVAENLEEKLFDEWVTYKDEYCSVLDVYTHMKEFVSTEKDFPARFVMDKLYTFIIDCKQENLVDARINRFYEKNKEAKGN